MKQDKEAIRYKYANRCGISYPNGLYIAARKWARAQGITIQDVQRQAMRHYVDHLEKKESDKTI